MRHLHPQLLEETTTKHRKPPGNPGKTDRKPMGKPMGKPVDIVDVPLQSYEDMDLSGIYRKL